MVGQLFDEVLELEQELYNNAYKQGLADGEAAGQSEGRTLGLEKGFERFLESGKLHGKSLIWANQTLSLPDSPGESRQERHESSSIDHMPASKLLKPLPNGQKVSKHVKALHALVEPETLSTQNNEDAISDFNNRIKRARAKSKLIEILILDSKPKSNRIEQEK